MPKTAREDVAELLRLGLIDLDTEIVDLQEKRAQLSAMIVGNLLSPR